MKKEKIFYLILISTVLAMRLWVFLFPQLKLMIAGTVIHHFWIGLILALFALSILNRCESFKITLFSIGAGLMADELIYITLGGKTVSDYWSTYSVFGAIIMIVIIFCIKKWLTTKII